MARGSENTNGKLVKWCEGPEKTFPNRLRYTEEEERVRVHEYTVYPKKKERKKILETSGVGNKLTCFSVSEQQCGTSC